jgi:hypothetical protein
MMAITCDSCKKVILNPIRDESYYPLLHKDLCRGCYKSLRITIEDIMEMKRPNYTLTEHKQQLLDNLNRMTR